jgi:hypothetical protein
MTRTDALALYAINERENVKIKIFATLPLMATKTTIELDVWVAPPIA